MKIIAAIGPYMMTRKMKRRRGAGTRARRRENRELRGGRPKVSAGAGGTRGRNARGGVADATTRLGSGDDLYTFFLVAGAVLGSLNLMLAARWESVVL